MYRWPVPYIEGQCTLNLKFHVSALSDTTNLEFHKITMFLDNVFNPKGIYFNYAFNVISNLQTLPTSPPYISIGSVLGSSMVQSHFSTTTLDYLLLNGDRVVQFSSTVPALGEKAYTFVPDMPSNGFASTFVVPDTNSGYDEDVVNRRVIAHGLGKALGLFPTSGLVGKNLNFDVDTESQTVDYCNAEIGFDFICETSELTCSNSSDFTINWNDCKVEANSSSTSRQSFPSINNIMSDADFFRECPNEITQEQGRKIDTML